MAPKITLGNRVAEATDSTIASEVGKGRFRKVSNKNVPIKGIKGKAPKYASAGKASDKGKTFEAKKRKNKIPKEDRPFGSGIFTNQEISQGFRPL